MEDNLEKAKVGLLAVIALCLIVNTYFVATEEAPEPILTNQPTAQAGKSKAAANSNPTVAANPAANNGTNLNQTQFTPSANIQNNNDPVTPPKNTKTTAIQFAEYKHNFGQVTADTDNFYTFNFTNTGDEPLIIENAKGSCGCTVPDYPKTPIMPGATGEISIKFHPSKTQTGSQNKSVTVTANTNPEQTVLQISADVQPAAS